MAGRAGMGRPKGSPNKATADIKAAFRKHKSKLVKRILTLADSSNEQVAHAAAKTALEYAFGKPAQAMELTGKDGVPVIDRIEVVIVDPKVRGG